MRGLVRSGLLVWLILVAVLGGVLGSIVTRQLQPKRNDDGARVSVIALPPTETPSPSPSPTPTPSVTIRPRGTAPAGGGRREVPNCPANCTCEFRPPNGIVYRCGD